jgi:putative Ca2+/H+ antiporter (TMEM165/GDT1 family)
VLLALFSTIMATEIDDKTFFIAAILIMRNYLAAVFGGAILALIVKTALGTLMSLILPTLLPKKYTHIIGGAKCLYFSCRLLFDSRGMEDTVSEELEEVEDELAEMNRKERRHVRNPLSAFIFIT